MNEKFTELQNAFDQSIKNLTEAFEGLKAEIIKVDEPEQVPDLQILPPYQPTPNEQRAELIENAINHMESMKSLEGNYQIKSNGGNYYCYPVFTVNKSKRTVTCKLRGISNGHVRKRATARCHPNDVFNERLGELISLSMCLGKGIPLEFLNAVQPDYYVPGHVITFPKTHGPEYHYKRQYLINSVEEKQGNLTQLWNGKSAHANLRFRTQFDEDENTNTLPIIDDTNAVYADDTQ